MILSQPVVSGKSTLALSLFRFVDPERGHIVIDGVDITTIGVEDLRSKMTLIPQDAVLFTGTVRDNLVCIISVGCSLEAQGQHHQDPFKTHTDAECLDVLRQVLLVDEDEDCNEEAGARHGAGSRTSSAKTHITLDSKVSEGGSNFSAGQRQLLAMAVSNQVMLIFLQLNSRLQRA